MQSRSRKARRPRVEAGFALGFCSHKAAEHCRTPKRHRDRAHITRLRLGVRQVLRRFSPRVSQAKSAAASIACRNL
jgi:hypothetical protein